MLNVLRTMLTGKDNQSGDIHRALVTFFAIALVGQQVYALVWMRQPFDAVTAVTAYGGLLAASSVGLKIKASTEPGG